MQEHFEVHVVSSKKWFLLLCIQNSPCLEDPLINQTLFDFLVDIVKVWAWFRIKFVKFCQHWRIQYANNFVIILWDILLQWVEYLYRAKFWQLKTFMNLSLQNFDKQKFGKFTSSSTFYRGNFDGKSVLQSYQHSDRII